VGDEVVVLPAGTPSRVTAIDSPRGGRERAAAPASITVALEDELDVGRGDLIAGAGVAPEPRRELTATLCWLGDSPARAGGSYLLKHTTRTVRAKLDAIEHRLDVTTFEHEPATELELNAIGRVRLRTGAEVMADPYARSRATGAFILIDEATNDTVGAGMVA
jgi:sulfate adenylyltransferase subunit 1 (EFTu-like GTPase family)